MVPVKFFPNVWRRELDDDFALRRSRVRSLWKVCSLVFAVRSAPVPDIGNKQACKCGMGEQDSQMNTIIDRIGEQWRRGELEMRSRLVY